MLSRDAIIAYHERGFLGPFTVIEPEEMTQLRAAIDQDVLGAAPTDGRSVCMARHMDSPAVRRIATAAPLVDRLKALLGDDLVLWNSYFWNKEPGGLAIPWHQDIAYWPIEPWLNISAWVAIDAVDRGNSCVQLIPGSHRQALPHVASSGTWFAQEADPSSYDASTAVCMELAPGQAFLFNERMLHHSEPNRSDRRRLGMSLRFTTPYTRIDHDRPPLFPGHRALLVSGEDHAGLNRYLEPVRESVC